MAVSGGVFHADLHLHSRFSRACSKDGDLANLAWWALRKGVTVVGTGDFTHPAWAAELAESLVPAEPGLLRLRPEIEDRVVRSSPPACRREVRFLLSAEISTIYRRGDRTRKVHHLLYAPGFDAADRITAALAKVGNLASDGRPILGLDSRHLLEITLDGGPGCFLIPAHIWTPWFAVLGSKSGFDTIAACYGDLAPHVFAAETGLSSDPPMNWMCSALDGYRLVSNSDAHSPPMLGREATTFSTELDYFAMAEALRTGNGLAGTINFFPEGGRYHLDGHRRCGICCEPAGTRAYGGNCPECGKPLTIGVLHRVAELADRPAGYRPAAAADFTNLVALPALVGEILSVGAKSKRVAAEVTRLVAALGPELAILRDVPVADVARTGGSLLGEAVARLRRGEVTKQAGYDGEYGVIQVFRPGELDPAAPLFDLPRARAADHDAGPAGSATPASQRPDAGAPVADAPQPRTASVRDEAGGRERYGAADAAQTAGLDPDQRAAAAAPGPLMIIAGPGTGKTRTLAYRIAAAVTEQGVRPDRCLAITFTRRAAQELAGRVAALLPRRRRQPVITTFHGLGLLILRECHARAGLSAGFGVAGEEAVRAVAAEVAGSERAGARLLAAGDPQQRELLRAALAGRDLVDFDGLLELPVELLRDDPVLAERHRQRWQQICVDEYQDVDARQYELLRLLAGNGRGLTAIGDPDQAIYGFRGADVGFFLSFGRDYPEAATVQLTRNYRSSPAIVASALQAVAPATLVPDRALHPARPADRELPGRITLHQAADEEAEGAWIAETIDRLLGGASFHSLDTRRADGHGVSGLALAGIAVLYRTDAQAAALGQALTRAGLPFQKRSHDRLARRTAVRDIVRELSLAAPAEGNGAAGGEGPAGSDAAAGSDGSAGREARDGDGGT
ncbi:MAG: UvrD-helicase domain-containing protein, partial [Nocardiopsaceae bacterium]|nr:UvrD-helicase domain-containing protein [Nocardiopsaceae bacterium]